MGKAEKINRFLSNNELSTLDSPRELMQQLAFMVKSPQQFKAMLAKVEPENRRIAYESMAPFLSFRPAPLSDYMTQLKQDAEHDRLPTFDPESGEVVPFSPARNAKTAEESLATKYLTLTCSKCTVQATFFGETVVEAAIKAREKGWFHDHEREICPKCPAPRPD